MLRTPAVANQFYPGAPATLKQTVSQLTATTLAPREAIAAIAPHAGYIYSGPIAGETFARLRIPPTVVILGPNHHGLGSPASLAGPGAWQMPFGRVPINEELSILLEKSELIVIDDLAHRQEHSLEVMLPFLQYFQPQLTIVPLVLAHLSLAACRRIGEELATAITAYGQPVLIVASSDMSHYLPRREANAKDQLALAELAKLDPAGLYATVRDHEITMCGVVPATIALVAAKQLGASQVELVRYGDSGETSGDTSQVVGYAGLIIS